MPWTIESIVMAILFGSLFVSLLAPAFFSTFPPAIASQLNLSASNGTSSLQGLIYTQVYNVSQCGSASTCTNTTGGLNTAPTGIFQGYAFYLQGFGSLVKALLNAPLILSVMVNSLFADLGYPMGGNAAITAMQQFISFIITIVGVSAIMKYPMRSG